MLACHLCERKQSGIALALESIVIAVIFEVHPNEGRRQEYLDLAAELRPMLNQVNGFISIERFESLAKCGFNDEPVLFHRADLALLRDVELLRGGKVGDPVHAGQ